MKNKKKRLLSLLSSLIIITSCSKGLPNDQKYINSDELKIIKLYNPEKDEDVYYFLRLGIIENSEILGRTRENIIEDYKDRGFLGEISCTSTLVGYYELTSREVSLYITEDIVESENLTEVKTKSSFANNWTMISYVNKKEEIIDKTTNTSSSTFNTRYVHEDMVLPEYNKIEYEDDNKYTIEMYDFYEFYKKGNYTYSEIKELEYELNNEKKLTK